MMMYPYDDLEEARVVLFAETVGENLDPDSPEFVEAYEAWKAEADLRADDARIALAEYDRDHGDRR